MTNVPMDSEVCFVDGDAAFGAGMLEAALGHYAKAVDLGGDPCRGHYNRGVVLQALERWLEAEAAYRQALAICPNHVDALNNLAIVLGRLHRHREAMPIVLQALELAPRDADVLNTAGLAASQMGDFEAAIACFRAALVQNPLRAIDWLNHLGQAYLQAGRLVEAETVLNDALARVPDDARARFNLAVCYLVQGEWGKAWPLYEGRYFAASARARGLPRWDGRPVEAGELLLWGEQGLGDQILFAGMVPKELTCVLEVGARLVSLFARSFPAAQVVAIAEPPAPAACSRQMPLAGLGALFRRRIEDFPKRRAYLQADPERVSYWRQRLGPGPNIGINTSGDRGFVLDRWRTVPPEALAPLSALGAMRWFNLNLACPAELREVLPLEDWPEALDGMDETAAFVCALDLVVSSCTAMAHLAAALGRETWVLVHQPPYWVWGHAGTSTPWYPSARIFRQKKLGDWGPVVAELSSALAERLAGWSSPEQVG